MYISWKQFFVLANLIKNQLGNKTSIRKLRIGFHISHYLPTQNTITQMFTYHY